jgi:hypothetical protein
MEDNNSLLQTKQEIKDLYKELEETASLNPKLYIMPTSLYDAFYKKIFMLDEKLKRQTKSIMDLKKLNQKLKEELLKCIKQKENSEVKK